jgi:hypothetical protein
MPVRIIFAISPLSFANGEIAGRINEMVLLIRSVSVKFHIAFHSMSQLRPSREATRNHAFSVTECDSLPQE